MVCKLGMEAGGHGGAEYYYCWWKDYNRFTGKFGLERVFRTEGVRTHNRKLSDGAQLILTGPLLQWSN